MIIYKDAAYPIAYHQFSILDTKGRQHPVPSVVVLKDYYRFNGGFAKCTLRNIIIRDMHTCQYCGTKFDKKALSVDHVIPRSFWYANKLKGSPTIFNNVVTACKPCNRYKGSDLIGYARYPNRVKESHLQHMAGKKHEIIKEPKAITYAELLKRQMLLISDTYPKEWDDYIKR